MRMTGKRDMTIRTFRSDSPVVRPPHYSKTVSPMRPPHACCSAPAALPSHAPAAHICMRPPHTIIVVIVLCSSLRFAPRTKKREYARPLPPQASNHIMGVPPPDPWLICLIAAL